MRYIIASDIFGKTPALALLAQSIRANNNFTIITPYQNGLYFTDEAQAYEYFSQQVGIENYYQQLSGYLKTIKQPFRLIGFSAGAAVCWQHIAKNNAEYLLQSDLFYGSQIRNMQSLVPLSPVNLILPKSEPHFSIDDHIQALTGKKHTSIEHSEYLHGFMNQLSKNYHQQAYAHYVNVLSRNERTK